MVGVLVDMHDTSLDSYCMRMELNLNRPLIIGMLRVQVQKKVPEG